MARSGNVLLGAVMGNLIVGNTEDLKSIIGKRIIQVEYWDGPQGGDKYSDIGILLTFDDGQKLMAGYSACEGGIEIWPS
jgi:hypothetical protein